MRGSKSTTAWRWTCLGQDRLYVSLSDGRSIGWSDLTTGLLYPSSPESLPALAKAVDDWKVRTQGQTAPVSPSAAAAPAAPIYGRVRSRPPTPVTPPVPLRPPASSASPGPSPVPSPVLSPAPAASPAGDQPCASAQTPPPASLLNNAPGAAARAQATALRDASPIRTFLARLADLQTAERAWRRGAEGEEMVAAQLAGLIRRDPRWRVLHAIPVGARGADIDHLVIGPGGVFTLNAKHHPDAAVWVGGDTFLLNGHRQPYIRNSRHEAARAARLLTEASGLETHVHGVIVPVRARNVTIKTMPADVAVVPRRQIGGWLAHQPHRLDDHLIAVLFETAQHVSTWQRSSARGRR